jgi:hypothetical protein
VTGGGAGLAGHMDSLHLAPPPRRKSSDGTIVRPNREMRKSRYRRRMRALAVVLAAGLLAGCGGKRPVTLSGCLNDAGFLVTASGAKVEGASPGGIGFTLTVYRSAAAAKRAASNLDPQTTALVETGVVDFQGNPSPGAKISGRELESIRRCLEKTAM